MKNIITIIILIYSAISYGQSISISDNSNNKTAIVKVELPENYELKFFRNDILIKSLKFVGVQYFKIEKIKDHRLTFKNDKKNKIFNLYFNNDFERFKSDLIIDYQEEYGY